MLSKSLKQAMAEANAKQPKPYWDAQEGVTLEVVAANSNTKISPPRIGLQLQREDGKRKWFDLYFDEENPKGYRITGLKLRALGCGDLIDQIDEQYPVVESDPVETQEANAAAQLDAIASALRGVVFVGVIDAKERNDSTPENPAFNNYFKVTTLVEGPAGVATAAPAAGFGAKTSEETPAAGFGFGAMG